MKKVKKVVNKNALAALFAAGLLVSNGVHAADIDYVKINDNGEVNREATATARYGVAVGIEAAAAGSSSVAVGTRATTTGETAVAVGSESRATGRVSVALGQGAAATAAAGTALGRLASASEGSSTAVGSASSASGQYSTAVGAGANASAGASLAFGTQAKASGSSGVALGRAAEASEAYSVALGAASQTDATVGTSSATVNGVTYSGFAGTSPLATVSVGSSEYTRTITNVAAGRISATSTDAINGSQLYMVANQVGENTKAIATNTAAITTNTTAIAANAEAISTNQAAIATNASEIANIKTVNAQQDVAITNAKTEVVAGENVTVSSTSASGPTVYTINAAGSSTAAGSDYVTVTSETSGNNTTYTVDISAATKQAISQVNANTNSINNMQQQINQYTTGLDNVNRRVNDMEKDLRAGIAGATAIAFLQRPNGAGKSLVSVAVGGYRDQQAVAVGYARNSDNNKWSIKAGVGLNTQKDVNWGGSVGYQW